MKKLLVTLLAVALVVSASFALVVSSDAAAEKATSVTVAGTTLDAETASTADGKITFADGTLTLDGAAAGDITAQGALTIVLKGQNTATRISMNTADVANSLTIQGDGTLTMGTKDSYLDVSDDNIIDVEGSAASFTVAGSATVSAYIKGARGIYVASKVGEAKATFRGSSTVVVNTYVNKQTLEALMVYGVPSTTLITENAKVDLYADTCAFRMGHVNKATDPKANHSFRIDGNATLSMVGRSQPFYIGQNVTDGDTYKVEFAGNSNVSIGSDVGGCTIFCIDKATNQPYEVDLSITSAGAVKLFANKERTAKDGVAATGANSENLIILDGTKANLTIEGSNVVAETATNKHFLTFKADAGTVTLGGNLTASVTDSLIVPGKATVVFGKDTTVVAGADEKGAAAVTDPAAISSLKYLKITVPEPPVSSDDPTSSDTGSATPGGNAGTSDNILMFVAPLAVLSVAGLVLVFRKKAHN